MPPVPPILELADPDVVPDLSVFITDDGQPVESLYIEKARRLLTEPLHSSWAGPGDGRSFNVMANVGLFYSVKLPPFVPDVMLSVDVPPLRNLHEPENRAYFTWIVGKMPDVVIEIVFDAHGDELSVKKADYARVGIPFYVVYDPDTLLNGDVLQAFVLTGGKYQLVDPDNFGTTGLGLRLWSGSYEGVKETWLRWCDKMGLVIPTGLERSREIKAEIQRGDEEIRRHNFQKRRANDAAERIKQLESRLRSLGHEVDGQ